MCFWVEVYMFFVLHNYHDKTIIFFVFVGLERKVFAIPQLSPIYRFPFPILRFFTVKSPSVTQRSVSQENAYKKS